MSKYSSILFGAESYEEIGPFRFPVWGELAPGEIRAIEELTRKETQSTFYSLKLAHKIATQENISEDEALKILGNLGDEKYKHYVYEYAEDLDLIQGASMTDLAKKIEYVSIFMKFRGEVKLTPDSEYIKTRDWTVNDTERIPGDMLQSIYDFCIRERDAKVTPEGDEAKKERARVRRI